jgi:hypothetical protein
MKMKWWKIGESDDKHIKVKAQSLKLALDRQTVTTNFFDRESEWLLFNAKLAIFHSSALSLREQVTFDEIMMMMFALY